MTEVLVAQRSAGRWPARDGRARIRGSMTGWRPTPVRLGRLMRPCDIRLLGFRRRAGDGGDEETRTPDPLLAKEMLYRLSYVP